MCHHVIYKIQESLLLKLTSYISNTLNVNTCDHDQLLCWFMCVYFMCVCILLFEAQKWSSTSSLRRC